MPNQELNLVIQHRVSGAADIERLNAAHGRLYDTVDRGGKVFEDLARRTAAIAEATKHAGEAAFGLVSAYGAATYAMASHAVAADRMVNVYRGVRLALSPTMFTAYTLAAGAAVEGLIKLTNAQARFNEQTAIQAGRAGRSFYDQYGLNLIQQRQGFDFGPALSAFRQGRPDAGLGEFGEALKRIGEIKDPIDRVKESIRVFGRDVGEQILPQLNERFATNQERIQEWGIGIDKVGRENLQQFKEDFHSFFRGFSEDADAIVLLAKKVGLGLSEITADSYVWLKQHYEQFQKNMGAGVKEYPGMAPGIGFDPNAPAGSFESRTSGLFLEPFDIPGAIAGTRTMQGMVGALRRPGMEAMRSFGRVGFPFPLGAKAAEIIARGDRDREKAMLEERTETNQQFLLHPEDTAEFLQERPLREAQLVRDTARLKVIKDQIQAEKDAEDAAEKAATQMRVLAQSLLEIKERAAIEGLTGVPRALAENQATVANLRQRYGGLFTPEMQRQLGASLFPRVTAAQTEDALKASREQGQRDVELTQQFGQYGRTALPAGVFGPSGGLEESLRQSYEQVQEQKRTDREVRMVQLNAGRESIIRTAGRQQSLAEINAAPGYAGAVEATNRGYETRLALARELRQLDIDTAYQELDASKQRVDLARAEADYTRQSAEAAIDRELKLAQLQKQRVDEFRNVAVDFVNAAESRNLPGFFKAQGQRIQNQVVGNAAEMAFKFLPNTSLTNDPNSILGRLLAGTPFGAKAADPATRAVQDTAQYTKDTRDILAQMATSSGLQLPGGLGIPGGSSTLAGLATIAGLPGLSGISNLSKFGSDINGLTGSGSLLNLFAGRSSAAPSVTADELSSLGVFGPALAGTTAASSSSWKNNSIAGSLFDSNASTSARVTSGIASAGIAYAGTMAAIKDFKRGGAGGVIGGIGDIAGTAAAFDPEPISKAILAGVAIGSQFIKGILGDPRANRQRDINNRLAADQFYQPVAIDAVMSTSGSAVSTDRYGNVQLLDASPYPQVQQPYADLSNGLRIPGRSVSPVGGPSGINPGPSMTMNVYTMDSHSFGEFLDKNKGTLGDKLADTVLHGHGERFVEVLADRR